MMTHGADGLLIELNASDEGRDGAGAEEAGGAELTAREPDPRRL
jgi:hypothetical protein